MMARPLRGHRRDLVLLHGQRAVELGRGAAGRHVQAVRVDAGGDAVLVEVALQRRDRGRLLTVARGELGHGQVDRRRVLQHDRPRPGAMVTSPVGADDGAASNDDASNDGAPRAATSTPAAASTAAMTKAAIRRPPESVTEWFPRHGGITKR
jgi:hypothetical protein